MKTKTQKEMVIFTDDLQIEDYKEFFEDQENDGIFYTDEEKYSQINDMLQFYIEDLQSNLNVIVDNDIICIASLGLWNGRKQGYKILTDNLKSILNVMKDSNKIYVDRYDLKATCHHHDGSNYYTFRELRHNMEHDGFLNKLYHGKATQKDITRHTKTLKNYVKEIYGF